jgi:hypothetical protein
MSSTVGLTVVLPQNLDYLEPIEVFDKFGLRSALIERYALGNLPSEWDRAEGFYVLLSSITPDNKFTAYVGQTDYSFRRRLADHDGSKDYWSLAVLFKRDAGEPFNRNETRYLEGLMVTALQSSPNVTVRNIKPTGEKNLPEHDKAYMDSMLLSALRVLFLRGYRNAHLGAITRTLESAEISTSPTVVRPPVTVVQPPATVSAPPFTAPALPRMTVPTFSVPTALPMVEPVAPVVESTPEPPKTLGSLLFGPRKKQPAQSQPQLSDEELYKRLKKITYEIRQVPEHAGGYQYWASNRTINQIVETKPKTVKELTAIYNVGSNMLSRADDIVRLFNPGHR